MKENNVASEEQGAQCPPDRLSEVLAVAQADEARGVEAVDGLLAQYPGDGRLHFLRGSLLAGLRLYEEAHQAMQTAVAVAPGFALARFQLGLLELTSGNAAAAETTWLPLQALPADDALRLFATGLNHLIRDDFTGTIELLEQGMARNTENVHLNNDMQMVIAECLKKLDEQGGAEAEPTSAAALLLKQYGKGTQH